MDIKTIIPERVLEFRNRNEKALEGKVTDLASTFESCDIYKPEKPNTEKHTFKHDFVKEKPIVVKKEMLESVSSQVSSVKSHKLPEKKTDNPVTIAVLDEEPIVDKNHMISGDFDSNAYFQGIKRSFNDSLIIDPKQQIGRIHGEIPAVSKMEEVFNEVKNDASIPWEYLADGCYARAHEAANRLYQKGYNCQKIFIIDNTGFGGDSLKAKNDYTKGSWRFHVGALTFARDEKTGKVEGFVFDAGLDDKPLKVEEWISRVWNRNNPVRIKTTQADVSFFIDSDREKPSSDFFSIPKFYFNLAIAKIHNMQYGKALQEIKQAGG